MARTRFVRRECPGAGFIGVVGLRPVAILIFFEQRYDEIRVFAGIADHSRRLQVRRRLRRGFCGSRNADSCIPVRECDELLPHDNLFDIA